MDNVSKIVSVKRRGREYKFKEERSYAWIAKQADIGASALQKFLTENGRTMTMDNINKLDEFLTRAGY